MDLGWPVRRRICYAECYDLGCKCCRLYSICPDSGTIINMPSTCAPIPATSSRGLRTSFSSFYNLLVRWQIQTSTSSLVIKNSGRSCISVTILFVHSSMIATAPYLTYAAGLHSDLRRRELEAPTTLEPTCSTSPLPSMLEMLCNLIYMPFAKLSNSRSSMALLRSFLAKGRPKRPRLQCTNTEATHHGNAQSTSSPLGPLLHLSF